jgi:Predicted transcriptional regulators
MTTGQNIKKIRKEKGLTQRELADILETTQQNLAQYENDKRNPKIETIEKIADALNVSIRDIKEDLTILEWEQTREANRSFKAIEGIIALLEDIYGRVKIKEVEEGYSCGYFYVVYTKDGEFILHADDVDTLYYAARASIPYIVDRIKDTRSVSEVYKEYASIEPYTEISEEQNSDV